MSLVCGFIDGFNVPKDGETAISRYGASSGARELIDRNGSLNRRIYCGFAIFLSIFLNIKSLVSTVKGIFQNTQNNAVAP